MKTENEILKDIVTLEKEQEDNRKNNKKSVKINRNPYMELIKITKVLSEGKVRTEYKKLTDSKEKINSLFDEYLLNFSKFQLSDAKEHLKAVKREFKADFGIRNIDKRIKRLEYLLKITDEIKIN